MIYIEKGREPRSLTQYKSQPGANYDGYTQKDDVRIQLLNEQGYLCAYCMSRISIGKMKIEHWKAQKALDGTGPEHELDYRNMLGVCEGNKSNPLNAQTCDAHRGNTDLFVDPRNEEHIKQIEYRSDGTIYSKNERIDFDLNEKLNLNSDMAYIKASRKEAIKELQKYLKNAQSTGIWEPKLLNRIKNRYLEKKDGKYEPYVGALLFFVEKYLKKTAMQRGGNR